MNIQATREAIARVTGIRIDDVPEKEKEIQELLDGRSKEDQKAIQDVLEPPAAPAA